MFDQNFNTFTKYSNSDERNRLSVEDIKIVGQMTYFQLLQKFDKDEIKLQDLNLRM
jgi:hypothetical protein